MKRKLTDEERRLWAEAARAVRPLGASRAPLPRRGSPPPTSTDIPEKAAGDFGGPGASPLRAAPTPPLAPLARRERQRLARGRSTIEARIDLHGMTQAKAHAALLRFLHAAQAEGATFVLVITGTGARGPDGERGVLKRQAPLWLGLPEFRPYVLAFEPAHAAHGGAGALYVRLRRARA